MIFVQSTPGEVLKKGVQDVMSENGMKVKVVEQGGRTIRSLLQKSDIHPKTACEMVDCPICLTKPSGMCSKESVGYEIWCFECEKDGVRSIMHGETGRTARMRCGEHRDNLAGKRGGLWEHCLLFHSGEKVNFGYKVVGAFKDPLQRQLNEAIRIERETGNLMNSKNEWVGARPAGYRHTVERLQ